VVVAVAAVAAVAVAVVVLDVAARQYVATRRRAPRACSR
jgi:hypothetical protein